MCRISVAERSTSDGLAGCSALEAQGSVATLSLHKARRALLAAALYGSAIEGGRYYSLDEDPNAHLKTILKPKLLLESWGAVPGEYRRKYPIEHKPRSSPVAVLACSSDSSLNSILEQYRFGVRALDVDASGKIGKSCYRAEGAHRAER